MSRSTKKKLKHYMKKHTAALAKEDNEQAYQKIKIAQGQHGCTICPPWKFENAVGKKHGKHGKTKPKYKDKR